MLTTLRAMPAGIRLFLGYAFLILGLVGASLRWVVDQAISAPISPIGIIVMILLAYTVFTTTLVLQRKEASHTLALGLASLVVPGVPLLLLSGLLIPAIVLALFGVLLFHGLRRPEARAWLSEP